MSSYARREEVSSTKPSDSVPMSTRRRSFVLSSRSRRPSPSRSATVTPVPHPESPSWACKPGSSVSVVKLTRLNFGMDDAAKGVKRVDLTLLNGKAPLVKAQKREKVIEAVVVPEPEVSDFEEEEEFEI